MGEKMSKKKKKSNKLFIFIFVLGLGILSYPLISNWYYRIEANNQVADYKEARDLLSDEEIQRRLRLAQIYNDNLGNVTPKDPYSEEEKHKAIENYAQMLELRTKIGTVEVPSIDVDLPIYAGTNEEILQKGAGHLEGTSLPIGGESSHTVITAHSGLPSARLFTDLEKVEMGTSFTSTTLVVSWPTKWTTLMSLILLIFRNFLWCQARTMQRFLLVRQL